MTEELREWAEEHGETKEDYLPNPCEHENTAVFTTCCGEEAKDYNETTICPSCHDHTGFTEECGDCGEVIRKF